VGPRPVSAVLGAIHASRSELEMRSIHTTSPETYIALHRYYNQGQTTDRSPAMNMSNISEPFILATYTSTIRDRHLLRKPNVYATVSRKSSADDQVTVAVQADGVHILDVSNLLSYLTNGWI
jgi:hypothetical protein